MEYVWKTFRSWNDRNQTLEEFCSSLGFTYNFEIIANLFLKSYMLEKTVPVAMIRVVFDTEGQVVERACVALFATRYINPKEMVRALDQAGDVYPPLLAWLMDASLHWVKIEKSDLLGATLYGFSEDSQGRNDVANFMAGDKGGLLACMEAYLKQLEASTFLMDMKETNVVMKPPPVPEGKIIERPPDLSELPTSTTIQ